MRCMQGLGRHSMNYIRRRMAEELAVCNELLGRSGAYLTGQTPTPADCYLYALIDLVRSVLVPARVCL